MPKTDTKSLDVFTDDVTLFSNLSMGIATMNVDRTVGEACATRGIALSKMCQDLEARARAAEETADQYRRGELTTAAVSGVKIGLVVSIIAAVVFGLYMLSRGDNYKRSITAKVYAEARAEIEAAYQKVLPGTLYEKDGVLYIKH